MHLLFIGLAGLLGTLARYGVDSLVRSWWAHPSPLGTLAVNITGSLVAGILFALVVERDLLSADARAPIMIGFVGAYTTFSTLAVDTWRLAESGAVGHAALNVVGSTLLGVAAVIAGLAIGRALGS